MVSRSVDKDTIVIGVDLLPVKPVAGVNLLQGSFLLDIIQEEILQICAGNKIDLLLSDMAPNLTGIKDVDEENCRKLNQEVIDFGLMHLIPSGIILMKVFYNSYYAELFSECKHSFTKVIAIKPNSSHKRSAENYLLIYK